MAMEVIGSTEFSDLDDINTFGNIVCELPIKPIQLVKGTSKQLEMNYL